MMKSRNSILGRELSDIPGRELVIIIRDFNAKVGSTKESDDRLTNIIGKYGLGERNESGECFIAFSMDSKFIITNSLSNIPHNVCILGDLQVINEESD